MLRWAVKPSKAFDRILITALDYAGNIARYDHGDEWDYDVF